MLFRIPLFPANLIIKSLLCTSMRSRSHFHVHWPPINIENHIFQPSSSAHFASQTHRSSTKMDEYDVNNDVDVDVDVEADANNSYPPINSIQYDFGAFYLNLFMFGTIAFAFQLITWPIYSSSILCRFLHFDTYLPFVGLFVRSIIGGKTPFFYSWTMEIWWG